VGGRGTGSRARLSFNARGRTRLARRLTGASGYTGGRLLSALLERGHPVSALVRPRSVTPALAATGARLVRGDLQEASAIAALVGGADAVVHVAAVYRTAAHSEAYYRAVNVEGTRLLAEAAARAGALRFVHTSTVGVHGHVELPPATEATPPAPTDVYQRSKLEGERAAREVARLTGLPTVVLRPAGIYGPGDRRHLKLFRAVARGRYAIVGSGTTFYHPVFIDDLVDGFLLALERPQALGGTFILGGSRYVTHTELAATVARHTRGHVLPFHVPAWPIQWAGSLCERLCVPFGIEPLLHRRRVDFWTKCRAFSIERARTCLGFSPKVDLDEGVRRTAEAYRGAGTRRALRPPRPATAAPCAPRPSA